MMVETPLQNSASCNILLSMCLLMNENRLCVVLIIGLNVFSNSLEGDFFLEMKCFYTVNNILDCAAVHRSSKCCITEQVSFLSHVSKVLYKYKDIMLLS